MGRMHVKMVLYDYNRLKVFSKIDILKWRWKLWVFMSMLKKKTIKS